MRRTSWQRGLAAASAVALLATACGGDDGTDDPAAEETTASDAVTEEPTEETTSEAAAPANAADGTLQLGYILPETGQLAFLGPPQIEAVKMAIEEMNAAGGVLGNEVTLSGADEAGDPNVAAQSAQRLLGEGVDAIVGAAASGMSLAFIDAVTNAGVAMCSGSNTSPTFTDYDDNGLYFRTAPSDALQGPVLAETIVGDGHAKVAVIGRADDYGRGLVQSTAAALKESGAEVVMETTYDPEAASYDAEIQQISSAAPDAVALIAFDEGAQLLKGLIEAGIGPDTIGVYGADGLRSTELPSLVDPSNAGIIAGMKGTAAAGEENQGFIDRLMEFAPDLQDTLFAAQAYDCAVMYGLAAIAADSDAGADIGAQMVEISKGGTKCTTFQECADLLAEGEDIDYDGASGPTDFVDAGEPSSGIYEVWEFQDDGSIETVTKVESNLG